MAATYEAHRGQLEAILRSWGMPAITAAVTADIMAWADLHGIDSHGMSMIPSYDERRRSGKTSMTAQPKVVVDKPVAALIDGGGGLGVNLFNGSFAAGISLTLTTNFTTETLEHVNGDGLPDIVMIGDQTTVRLNTGSGFAAAINWSVAALSCLAVDHYRLCRLA